MSYRAGGLGNAEPCIICNECGKRLPIRNLLRAPSWLLNRKAAPGWKMRMDGDLRFDTCPMCSSK